MPGSTTIQRFDTPQQRGAGCSRSLYGASSKGAGAASAWVSNGEKSESAIAAQRTQHSQRRCTSFSRAPVAALLPTPRACNRLTKFTSRARSLHSTLGCSSSTVSTSFVGKSRGLKTSPTKSPRLPPRLDLAPSFTTASLCPRQGCWRRSSRRDLAETQSPSSRSTRRCCTSPRAWRSSKAFTEVIGAREFRAYFYYYFYLLHMKRRDATDKTLTHRHSDTLARRCALPRARWPA